MNELENISATFTSTDVVAKGNIKYLTTIQAARLLPATIAALVMIITSTSLKPFDPAAPVYSAFDNEAYHYSVLSSFVASIPLWSDYFQDIYNLFFSGHNVDRPKQTASEATIILTSLLVVSIVNIVIFSFFENISEVTEKSLPAIIFAQYGFLLAIALIGMYDNITDAPAVVHSPKRADKLKQKPTAERSRRSLQQRLFNRHSVISWSSRTKAISFVGTAVSVALLYFESIQHTDEPLDTHADEHTIGGKNVTGIYIASVVSFMATALWMFYKLSLWMRYRRTFFPGIDKGTNIQFWNFIVFATVYSTIFFGYLIYWIINGFGTWVGVTALELTGAVWCQTAIMLAMTIVPAKIVRHAQQTELVS
jgi:magnesium-transporting ATPase (P-type)